MAKEKIYISLVYLGNLNWRAALYLNETTKKRAPSVSKHSHIDLLCLETKHLKSIKN